MGRNISGPSAGWARDGKRDGLIDLLGALCGKSSEEKAEWRGQEWRGQGGMRLKTVR